MKKKDVTKTLEALKGASICAMNKEDRSAILDNLIALSEEQEALSKVGQVAIDKLKPANFDELPSDEKQKALNKFNEAFMAFMEPKYLESIKATIHPISEEAMDLIFAQKEVTTEGKALIRKFLQSKN